MNLIARRGPRGTFPLC